MLEGLEDVMKDVKRSTKVDASAAVEEYINKEDWRISANANTGYSHAGLVNNLAGKMIANFWLDNVYTKKEGDAHRNGDYHIHDLDILAPYCFTADTCIKTMEYGDISIAELLDKKLESFTVFTTDLADIREYELKLEEDIDKEEYKAFIYKHFFTKKAKNLRKTRENSELLKLEFEDGYSVRCTPEHKFLGSFRTIDPLTYKAYNNFKWCPAEKLESGDEIVSYNGITKKIKNVTKLDEQEDVYCMEVEDTHCFALANGVIAHNCCGHDLQKLLREGFNGVISRVGSKPPKHVREALYQMANFIGILQAEWAGAQAFSSFDTFLGPLVFFDMQFGGVTEDDIKKAVRNFVYNLNVPSRWGQSPFSNITIDINCPRDLGNQMPMRGDTGFFLSIKEEYKEYFDTIEKLKKENYSTDELLNDKDALRALEKCTAWNSMIKELRNRVEGSEEMDEDTLLYSVTYKLFEPEMHIITKAYYEVMNEGDAYGLPFTFPIPTVNITENFDWDSEISDLVFENAAKYGSSYFQNFIGSQYRRNPETGEMERNPDAYSPNDVRSMCCRLQLDKTQIRKKLEKRGGGLFGSDAQTGSVGVVTINMARLGYNFKGNIKGLYKQLFKLMDMAKSTLEKKRKFVVSMNERGLYPYTHRYVRTLDTYFSTIGVNGMNEMIRNFTNDEYDITDPRGEKMANEVLDAIRDRLIKYQEETGNMYNLEATPAEGTTYRLAKEDAKRYQKRTVSYIMCPVHGKVEVNTTEEEVVCPLCEKEASKN